MKKKTIDFAKYTFVFTERERDASERRSDHQYLVLEPADIENTDKRDAGRDTDSHSFRLMEDRGFEAKVQGADPQSDLAVPSIDGQEVGGWQDTWVTPRQKKSWI